MTGTVTRGEVKSAAFVLAESTQLVTCDLLKPIIMSCWVTFNDDADIEATEVNVQSPTTGEGSCTCTIPSPAPAGDFAACNILCAGTSP